MVSGSNAALVFEVAKHALYAVVVLVAFEVARWRERWLGKFAQSAKWNFCLKAVKMAVEQDIR